MKLKPFTKVIVADSEKYLILNNQGDEIKMDLRVFESAERENPPARAQGTDRPGRLVSPSGQKSSVANSDWHELEKELAARDLAQRINGLASETDVNSIIVVTDAHTLGLLRPQLTPETSRKVIQEIEKDLTNHTVLEIENILGAVS